jgi:hypothetical protein
MKSIFFLLAAFFTLTLAQVDPSALPLTVGGAGSQISEPFVASRAWQVTLTEGNVGSIYLYDAATRQNLRKLESGEEIEQTGTFFIYVVSSSSASWTITIGDPAPMVTANPATTDMTDDTTSPVTPTEDTTTPTTPEEPVTPTLPPLERRTERNWNKHFGYEVSRFTRTEGATPGDCSAYPSALEAQAAFIKAGGPELDPTNLDTDGDGYGCDYNPFETSYAAAITCETGKQWANPRYRKDGTYHRGGCRPVTDEQE